MEAFKGEWTMVSSENFEKILQDFNLDAKTIEMAKDAKQNVKFEANGDGVWTFTTISPIWNNAVSFKLGDQFEEHRKDGRQMLTKFYLSPDNKKLIHEHRSLNGELVVTNTREILENGNLRLVSQI